MEGINKLMLVILDGWGHGKDSKVSAIARAKTPVLNRMYIDYPSAELLTHGENVGLPSGQMGNSEVGHMNIGAGRIVQQDILRINNALNDGTFAKNAELKKALQYAKKKKKPIHLLGLVSDGGVHSHIDQLFGLCDILDAGGVPEFYVHAFTDGRDTDPKSGANFLKKLDKKLGKTTGGKLASVVGRYYAMDRDKRWERTRTAYELLTKGMGNPVTNLIQGVKNSYKKNVTDEFIKPMILADKNGQAVTTIKDGDVVIFFNFRTDRCRQIVSAMTQTDMSEEGMNKLKLKAYTMTEYDKTFKDVPSFFEKESLNYTLGQVLSRAKLTQLRAAETEKYPHVTYFFSGGREKPFKGEDRVMVDSPKVATYDLKPQMSAYELTEAVVKTVSETTPDFVCINFANPDMVGHTGNIKATSKAVKAVDINLGDILDVAFDNKYKLIIMSDHGNAEYMVNEDGTPNTAHTTNPVPIIVIDPENRDKYTVKGGILADVAPTILHLMGVKKPKAMTGEVLVEMID